MFWYIFTITILLDPIASSFTTSKLYLLQGFIQFLIEPKSHSLTLSTLLLITKFQNRKIRQAAFSSLFLYPFLFLIKTLVGRGRPFLDEGIFSLHPCHLENIYSSFPSSHAAALGLFLTIFRPKYWPLISILSFVRVVQGVHYPSDVVIGFAVGFFIPRCTDLLLNKLEKIPPLSWALPLKEKKFLPH
ncbi:MAG: phosphatase PAP2 family protein [Chlamydiia bacterium]